MAWTTPKTWSAGETLTAANFNTHIRDNLLAVGPHLIVRKPSDESVTSSTVLQNDDHLALTIAANEVWHTRWGLWVSGGASVSNITVAFTFPASCVVAISTVCYSTSGTVQNFRWTGSSSPVQNNLLVTSTGEFFVLEGVVQNAGNAGTFQLQWAQATSNGTALVMEANSTLWAVKLA